MSRDYDAIAAELLVPYQDDPAPRARRIAGLYASLYLEDPLLHQWCGLASFVARHVGMGLESNLGPLQEHFARTNLAIYSDIVPAFLRFRDRAAIPTKLAPAFGKLLEADEIARDDLDRGESVAAEALWDISVIEQRDICQPNYERMGWLGERLLAPFVLFRFGYDSASPIVKFDGSSPSDLRQRLAWMADEVMPHWRAWRRANAEIIRADLDRVRREGTVRLDDLPARLGR